MTFSPDNINAMFLTAGGLTNIFSVRRIWLDKSVKGVSAWPVVFFFIWSVWDWYYFPHLDQWWSLGGSICAAIPNGSWLVLYWIYRDQKWG